MNKPLLSIIVPTHNRARYAMSCIASILNEVSGYFELIIHDTSEGNELKMFAESIVDDRLKYFKITEPLSMTENHNYAFSKANGKYLCLIGDDDTVAMDIMEVCKWANDNNIKIINHTMGANYIWPDFKSLKMGYRHSSRLYIKKEVGESSSLYNSKVELNKAFARAFQGVEDLPKIYHGIVRADLFEDIKNKYGNYFFGASPDISAAILLATSCESYIVTKYPFTVPGASGGSNTGRSAVGKHKGDLKTDPHTKRFRNLVWPEEVPSFFSVETVWMQAAMETLKIANPSDVGKINFARFYALCLLKHGDNYKSVLKSIDKCIYLKKKNQKIMIVTESINLLFRLLFALILRLSKPTAAGGKDYIENIHSLEKVPTLLKKYLCNKNITFKNMRELGHD